MPMETERNKELAREMFRKWKRFYVDVSPPEKQLQGVVLEREKPPDPAVLSQRSARDDLAQRLKEHRSLVEICRHHFDWITTLLRDIPHTISLFDRDGVVLYSTGNAPEMIELCGFRPGYDWSVAVMGLNAPGKAILDDRPVTVVWPENFFAPKQGCLCTAVPVHDTNRKVSGAIEISSSLEDGNPLRLAVISYIATFIEQSLTYQECVDEESTFQSIAELSSFAAHELMDPLSALKATLTLLSMQSLEQMSAKLVLRCIGITEQMKELGQDLRALGGAKAELARHVNLKEFIRNWCDTETLSVGYKLQVIFSGPSDNFGVPGNARLLARVLDNLVGNAIEAMREGGTIWIECKRRDEGVRLVVSDDGPGVPIHLQKQLFQKSFTTKENGSGLGLLLVKAIVERTHGGKIHYQANHPHGSRFIIDLPA